MKFKKPKFWDFKKPNFISYLLLPFTLFFEINNFLLKFKSKKKINKLKTICVGNIYVGGTGKTPTTIKLYEILKRLNLKVFSAKKFYPNHVDEKIILEKKTNLIFAENRKKIIEKALKENCNCLIFDDGLQEKKIDYDLQFVCFDTSSWIGNGLLIPAGPLRERLNSLKKYDGIFLKNESSNFDKIFKIIKKYNSDIQIYETYYDPINILNFDLTKNYLIFSGIGNPYSFKKILLDNNFNIIDEINFPDHYEYKKIDINMIKNKAKKINAKIITTEKDYVKISKFDREEIDFLEISLKIKNENQLIDFLKLKIYE